MGRVTTRWRVARLSLGAGITRREDTLVVEEPLEIRVGGRSLAVTMRTPGHDVELAAGFLVSEGVISRGEQFTSARLCAGDAGVDNTYNVLEVTLAPGVAPPAPELAREFFTTSSCGLCGKATIDAVRTTSAFGVQDDPLRVEEFLLAQAVAGGAGAGGIVEGKELGLQRGHAIAADGAGMAARENDLLA